MTASTSSNRRGGSSASIPTGTRRRSSTSPMRSPAVASRGCSRWPSPPTTSDPASSTSTTPTPRATPGSSSTRPKDGVVDESSARELLKVDQPYANHNGGLVLFGPDDLLYIGLGDGGSGGDPERRGLDLTTPLGKILRIDPEPDGDRPYTVPRGQSVRRQRVRAAGDLLLRPAQPVALRLRRRDGRPRDRRRRTGRRGGGRRRRRRAMAQAPASGGRRSRATRPSTTTRNRRTRSSRPSSRPMRTATARSPAG